MWRIGIFVRINIFRGFRYCLVGVRNRIRLCLEERKSGRGAVINQDIWMRNVGCQETSGKDDRSEEYDHGKLAFFFECQE